MDKINITQSKKGYLLRISASDSCNFDCFFCHPNINKHVNTLSDDDIINIIKSTNNLYKLKTIHFTGGEPLLRDGLSYIIAECKKFLDDTIEIAITTNGALLENKIEDLVTAGLNRMNISLHTLNQELFEIITNTKVSVSKIKDSISLAKKYGLGIKVNSIVIKGFNDNNIEEIASYCFDLGIIPRFLELGLYGPVSQWFSEKNFISHDEILEIMQKKFGPFKPDDICRGNGPSKYYINEKNNVFGIVNNQSNKLCVGCDRIRVSSDGMIRFCTFQPIDVRPYLKHPTSLTEGISSLENLMVNRGENYVGKRLHDIDYYFRWNHYGNN